VGAFALVRPSALISARLTWGPGWPMTSGAKPRALLEEITPRTARLYGGVAIIFGADLAALIIYSQRSRQAGNF
jgi:hypothetical protein